MNEECLSCEWYNKPYWSIISPCANCSKRFKNNTIKSTNYSINTDKTDLYKEIEQLEKRINKAIGHINACGCELSKDETRYLLEILKGGSNE